MAGSFHAKRVWLIIAVFAASVVLAHWNSASARTRGGDVAAGLALGLIIGGIAASQGNAGGGDGKTVRSCSSMFGPGAANAASNPGRCVCRSGFAWSGEGAARRCVARDNTTSPTVTRSVNGGKGTHSAAELEKIQEALNLLNYDAGEVDGAMGQKTQRAILKFQADKRFQQTGYLSPPEQQTLFADVEHKRALDARLKGPDNNANSASIEDNRGPAQTDTRMELAHWETVKNTKIPAELEDYIARFPTGAFTKLASLRLDQLKAQIAKEDEDLRGKRPEPAKDATGKVVKLPPVDDAVFPRAKQRRPDAVAVIIGNGAYRNGVPSVDFSERDAEAMKLVAMKTLGLDGSNIIFLKDATRGSMDEVFGTEKEQKGKLWRLIDPDGRSDVYVFYSGHGVPGTADTDGGSFLLPVDGDPNHANLNGYPLKQLFKNLADLKTNSVTVFLDACFSGQAADSNGTTLIKNASPVFIAKAIPRGVGKLNVFAAAGERQLSSWDPEAGHGIFTRYVLAGLAGDADTDRNKEITAKELRDYVGKQVRRAARRLHGRDQDPWFEVVDDNFVISSF